MPTYFTRIECTQNCRRWYTLHVQRTLFGEHELVARWGRLGRAGYQEMREVAADPADAQARLARAAQTRLARGYQLREVTALPYFAAS